MRDTIIWQDFLVWLAMKYGLETILHIDDLSFHAFGINDCLYEEGIVTDGNLAGVDPKLVYSLVFDHSKPLALSDNKTGIFPIDVFTGFFVATYGAGKIIGKMPFYSPAGKGFYFDSEAYLLIEKNLYDKISLPAQKRGK